MWSDQIKAGLRPVLFGPVAALWRTGFRLLGLLRPGPPPQPLIQAPRPRRVVIVAPHPDDETAGAGGCAALHQRVGDQVHVIVVTDGGASRAGGLSRDEIVRHRRAECRRALALLNITHVDALDLPERTFDPAALAHRLTPWLAEADLVYTPSCFDFHPDHQQVAHAVALALPDGATVRVMELGLPLGHTLVNCVIACRPVVHQKQAALLAYTTQQGALRPIRRMHRYRAARYGNGQPVETFLELSAPAFRRLMALPLPPQGVFYGFPPRPWTDPLAWLKGRGVRRAARDHLTAR